MLYVISFGLLAKCDIDLFLASQGIENFFKPLTKPDAKGNWLFPSLSTVQIFRFEDEMYTDIPPLVLSVLLRVVTSRLHSEMTNSIHSVRLKCSPETAQSEYINALRLLVPEASILDDMPIKYGDRLEDKDWEVNSSSSYSD